MHTYSYEPGRITVRLADSPGLMEPVFQDPSRAAMTWATVELLVNVTGMPAFVRTREGLTPWSSAQSTFLFADAMVNVLTEVHQPLAIACGPEGGLEPDEREAFEETGWRTASLGPNVLRFETAGIAALSLARALLKTT